MPTNDKIKEKYCEVVSCQDNSADDAIVGENMEKALNQARADTLSLAIARMKATKSNMCLRDRIILLDDIELLEKELKRLTK